MEDYKFGTSLAFEEVLKDKEKYVEIFSEGNRQLKELLLLCFDNGIETNLCCAGHGEDEIGYIKFNASKNKKSHINALINLVSSIPNVSLELSKHHTDDYVSLWIKTYRPDIYEILYEILNYAIHNKKNGLEISSDIKTMLKILENFKRKNYSLIFVTNNIKGVNRHSILIYYQIIKGEDNYIRRYILSSNIDNYDLENIKEEQLRMKLSYKINKAILTDQAKVLFKSRFKHV